MEEDEAKFSVSVRSLMQVRQGQEATTERATRDCRQMTLKLASWPDSWQGKKRGSSKPRRMLLAGDTGTSQEGFKWKSESKNRNWTCRKCIEQTTVSQIWTPQRGGALEPQGNQGREGLDNAPRPQVPKGPGLETNATAEGRARLPEPARRSTMEIGGNTEESHHGRSKALGHGENCAHVGLRTRLPKTPSLSLSPSWWATTSRRPHLLMASAQPHFGLYVCFLCSALPPGWPE